MITLVNTPIPKREYEENTMLFGGAATRLIFTAGVTVTIMISIMISTVVGSSAIGKEKPYDPNGDDSE